MAALDFIEEILQDPRICRSVQIIGIDDDDRNYAMRIESVTEHFDRLKKEGTTKREFKVAVQFGPLLGEDIRRGPTFTAVVSSIYKVEDVIREEVLERLRWTRDDMMARAQSYADFSTIAEQVYAKYGSAEDLIDTVPHVFPVERLIRVTKISDEPKLLREDATVAGGATVEDGYAVERNVAEDIEYVRVTNRIIDASDSSE